LIAQAVFLFECGQTHTDRQTDAMHRPIPRIGYAGMNVYDHKQSE